MLPMKNNNIIIVEIVEIIVEIIVEKCSNAIYTNVVNANTKPSSQEVQDPSYYQFFIIDIKKLSYTLKN